MKEHQIRSKDLKEVCGRYPGHLEKHARREFQNEFWKMHQCKLVLTEWETEAEADKARLDWLEKHGEAIAFNVETSEWGFDYDGSQTRKTLRELLDSARNAPQPKVTVIEEGK